MRVVVSQGELEDKLNMASKAIAKKSVKPILAGFLFDIGEDFRVCATDMETAVKATVVANEIDGQGRFVIEASMILDIVKNLPDDTVVLELEGDTLEVYSGRSHFSLATMDASEFPELMTADVENFIEMDTSILDEMIDKVIYAAATDEFMKNLNGVYWELSKDNLRLVASDGFRLALMDQAIEATDLSFLVSLKSMKELQNVISNTSEPSVKLRYDGKRLSVQAGDVEVTMRVVDADFPDYRRVLPQDFNTRAVVSRDDVLDALKRVMVIAKRGSDAVKVTLQEGTLIMTSRSPDYGEATEEVEADVEGQEITAAFNPKFLTEAIRRVDTPEVELLFVSETAPLKIKPSDREDYFFIIMPIRMA